jgi:hypothetical protein
MGIQASAAPLERSGPQVLRFLCVFPDSAKLKTGLIYSDHCTSGLLVDIRPARSAAA